MKHPLIYQINTRTWLNEATARLGRPSTLDDIPDDLLDWVEAQGFEWVWFLGVWQTGEQGRHISLTNLDLCRSYSEELPGWTEDDVVGSPFAIQEYVVNRDFGGDEALRRLRHRMSLRGLKLLLDFVPNHTAPDHPWVTTRPEFYVHGTEEDLAREPHNYTRVQSNGRTWIAAYGRDPYFAGWPDTLQLNYQNHDFREAMTRQLLDIAGKCDGVRCDMAMLVQPEIFLRTWGDRPVTSAGAIHESFWRQAIAAAKEAHPGFMFIAEVYWDMEWELQQEGFDYTYDKRLYDRLRHESPRSVHDHLLADPAYQDHSLRFLENHDEERASAAFPDGQQHRAAALITFLAPGLRFFYEGQFDGRKTHASMHLRRRRAEPPDMEIRQFYLSILDVLRHPSVHEGEWRLCELRPAWDGNDSWQQFIVWSWKHETGTRLAVVNYGADRGQCYVQMDLQFPDVSKVELADLLSEAQYERGGNDLNGQGLYLDMPGFAYHVFDMKVAGSAASSEASRKKSQLVTASS